MEYCFSCPDCGDSFINGLLIDPVRIYTPGWQETVWPKDTIHDQELTRTTQLELLEFESPVQLRNETNRCAKRIRSAVKTFKCPLFTFRVNTKTLYDFMYRLRSKVHLVHYNRYKLNRFKFILSCRAHLMTLSTDSKVSEWGQNYSRLLQRGRQNEHMLWTFNHLQGSDVNSFSGSICKRFLACILNLDLRGSKT